MSVLHTPSLGPHLGQPLERLEDAALLTGRGRYADDLPEGPRLVHAAFLRSPHPHAEIIAIDASRALALEGVVAVVSGRDLAAVQRPFVVGVKQPMEHRALALDRVRYVGEPVALVLAVDRYVAEDALDLIDVRYSPLAAVVTPDQALRDEVLLHPAVGTNTVSDRHFVYGDPDGVFARAAQVVETQIAYPRNAVVPIECFVVEAAHDGIDDAYDVMSNFQGPFALHPVMAMALNVPASHLRLCTPADSGGSFGVKQAVFPYIVALCGAARLSGRRIRWVEDRLEHLTAATSATNRVTHLRAAIDDDGRVLALDWDQVDDCGGYLRAPEPATLYRMHGNLNGAYDIAHMRVRNRVVLTNKTPSGLVRGFGGPQMYFALESLMRRIALRLDLDPLTVIRRNLIAARAFPYRTASGALLDSGDYQTALDIAVRDGGLDALKARRDQARAAGRLYGIGYAAAVEPSVSNMGYITTVLTPEEREKAGHKGGAMATATVSVDALGGVGVHVSSCPQGQGHRTVLAQVVADVLGLEPRQIRVNLELDTGKDAWSVASGNYSSRFAAAVAGSAHQAATRLRDKLAAIAAWQLGLAVDTTMVFAAGRIAPRQDPARSLPFHRVGGLSHWAAATLPDGLDPALRETVFWSLPTLGAPDAEDHVNSSGAYGFVFDYCGVEVDPQTGRVRIDSYVTMHDAGRILNPLLVDGQVRGAFANAVGAALYEHFSYGADGSFQSGTLADYLIPTACEVPDPVILHMETPSPFTPLGAKGVGEGNCMSTPVCIANAVADALGLEQVTLPLTPPKMAALLDSDPEPPPPETQTQGGHDDDMAEAVLPKRGLTGSGETFVPAPPQAVWEIILDPAKLAAVIPGCKELQEVSEHRYRAEVVMGIGMIRGLFTADVAFSDLHPPHGLMLSGGAAGPLGASVGEGLVRLQAVEGGTLVRYRYGADLSGKVAAVGGRMVEGAARVLIGQFFASLAAQAAPDHAVLRPSWWRRLLALVGVGR